MVSSCLRSVPNTISSSPMDMLGGTPWKVGGSHVAESEGGLVDRVAKDRWKVIFGERRRESYVVGRRRAQATSGSPSRVEESVAGVGLGGGKGDVGAATGASGGRRGGFAGTLVRDGVRRRAPANRTADRSGRCAAETGRHGARSTAFRQRRRAAHTGGHRAWCCGIRRAAFVPVSKVLNFDENSKSPRERAGKSGSRGQRSRRPYSICKFSKGDIPGTETLADGAPSEAALRVEREPERPDFLRPLAIVTNM
jgi:hypothetical protein